MKIRDALLLILGMSANPILMPVTFTKNAVMPWNQRLTPHGVKRHANEQTSR